MSSKKVIITCDSACDLPKKFLSKNKVKVVPLQILLGDDSYKDDGSLNPDKIYEIYKEKGILPKTAAFSPQTVIDFWKPFNDKGYEIVHIDLSSELSSTFQNAYIASTTFSDVYVVDSSQLSGGIGLLVLEACKLRDRGFSAQEIVEQLEVFKKKISLSFIVDNLEFLHKGGRCSALASMGGTMLQLKPCLEMREGVLKVSKKYRGSIDRVGLKYFGEKLDVLTIDASHEVFIIHSGGFDKKTLENFRDFVCDVLKVDTVYIVETGCTITSHCGPKTLGLAFIER